MGTEGESVGGTATAGRVGPRRAEGRRRSGGVHRFGGADRRRGGEGYPPSSPREGDLGSERRGEEDARRKESSEREQGRTLRGGTEVARAGVTPASWCAIGERREAASGASDVATK